jgi:CRISPR-associated protein Cas1
MGQLAEVAFSPRALERAWHLVLTKDREDGIVGPGVARFEADWEDRLTRLGVDLARGTYQANPLTEIRLPERDKVRLLHVPAVADRVVARAVLDAIAPVVDPHLGSCSYGFRTGLGVTDAIQAVASLRDEGLAWVLRTDVDECFPSVPVPLSRRMLGAIVDDEGVMEVVDALLARGYTSARRGLRIMRGLPQGCPLSPLLANLVLAGLDSDLLAEGFAVVRYADDITVVAASHDDAWEAARCATESLRRLGMQLGAQDTGVMSFAEGFTFLGEDFGPRYPPTVSEARVEEPERKVVYAGAQGGRIRTARGRLIIESPDDQPVLDIPTGHVGRIVCFGSVGLSAGVRSWALSSDVDIVFASRRGSYLGSFVAGQGSSRPSRIRAQLAAVEAPSAIGIARAVVDAKVRKQIVVLQRFGRRDDAEAARESVTAMQRLLVMIPDAQTSAEVMGLEGAAAAAYFPAYGQLFPEDLRFTNRSRQPPLDIANSALSFLYTILLGECVTAVYAAGLDPAFGILHSDRDDRPSLALDLLEEFRPWVVDQVVLSAARHRSLSSTHARTEEGRAGVMLSRAGREAVLLEYERRTLTRASGALPEFGGTIRRHLYRQAQRMAGAILDPKVAFTGTSWR